MNEIKITIEGLKELTEAVKALAGAGIGSTGRPAGAPQAVAFTPAPAMPTVPPAPNYGQAPAVTPVQPVPAAPPVQMPPVATAPVSVIPTTAVAQAYTLEQLQVAAAGLSGMGKMPQVMGILQQFGIQAMTELPPERYGDFATALREAGAQI